MKQFLAVIRGRWVQHGVSAMATRSRLLYRWLSVGYWQKEGWRPGREPSRDLRRQPPRLLRQPEAIQPLGCECL